MFKYSFSLLILVSLFWSFHGWIWDMDFPLSDDEVFYTFAVAAAALSAWMASGDWTEPLDFYLVRPIARARLLRARFLYGLLIFQIVYLLPWACLTWDLPQVLWNTFLDEKLISFQLLAKKNMLTVLTDRFLLHWVFFLWVFWTVFFLLLNRKIRTSGARFTAQWTIRAFYLLLLAVDPVMAEMRNEHLGGFFLSSSFGVGTFLAACVLGIIFLISERNVFLQGDLR